MHFPYDINLCHSDYSIHKGVIKRMSKLVINIADITQFSCNAAVQTSS